MTVSNGVMTSEDKEQLRTATEEVRFISRLGVFKCTNGIRPGEFSVLVGGSGNGKSTLCKTISIECAISGTKCYHLLSEEKTSVYKGTISEAMENATNGKAEKYLERLLFESMLDWGHEKNNMDYFFSRLEQVINEHLPEMVIFDNFTTSFIGDLPINKQGEAIEKLRKIAAFYDIALIGVFHTAKGSDLYAKILDGDSVRGNASSTNKGSYNYILSTFFRLKKPRAVLFLHKARYHKKFTQTYWELEFDSTLGIYTHAQQIDYETVKNIMDEANLKNKKAPKKDYSTWSK